MNKKITIKEYYELITKYGDLGVKVNTPYGYKKINGCEITEPNGKILKVIFDDGAFIEGSFKHKLKTKNGRFVPLSELTIGQEIQTINGNKTITSIINEGLTEDLYDIEVDEVRQYYSNGIVSHNSVLSIDLPMFLFFNETTKTTKAEEIFNKFTDKDKVTVKGEIIIDGEEYIIIRTIERKMSKKGEWNVKTELDFFKKLADGSLQNFTGEQRRETEKFIKESIGTKDDFLMTILTTSGNLEELIDSKPTARGQVLSRFMGLDFLKRKEEVAKAAYSEYSKSMLSNIYNTEQLKTDNEGYETTINELKNNLVELNKTLTEVDNNLTKGKTYRDDMLNKKHGDIDVELSRLNPSDVNVEIEGYRLQIEDNTTKMNELNVVEPTEFYYEDKHDLTKEEYAKLNKELIQLETKIEEVEKLKTSVEGGIKCEHCGIELMNAAITNAKIAELEGFIGQKDQIWTSMRVLSDIEQTFVRVKKEFDEYEKNKLIKEKFEATIESQDLNNLCVAISLDLQLKNIQMPVFREEKLRKLLIMPKITF